MKRRLVKKAFKYIAFPIEDDGTVKEAWPYYNTKASRYVAAHPEVLNPLAKKIMEEDK